MTAKEKLKLNAYIAEHVFGWAWYCSAGNAYLFPPYKFSSLDGFAVHWTRGFHAKGWLRAEPEKKMCKKSFEPVSVYGDGNDVSIPEFTSNHCAAMEVESKIVEKFGSITITFNEDGWTSSVLLLSSTDKTRPLASCNLAKKLF